jgi:hypothetical protein
MKPINTLIIETIKAGGHPCYWEPSKGNSHIPQCVVDKYPQMEFKGKVFYPKGRTDTFVRALYRDRYVQMEIGECFYYSIQDDFFYFSSDFQ